MVGDSQCDIVAMAGTKAFMGAFLRDFRLVAFMADMRENDISRVGSDDFGQKLRRCVVGKMPLRPHDALFQRPWAGGCGEKIEVVVAFENQRVAALKFVLDDMVSVSQVRGNTDFEIILSDDEGDGIDGIVWNGKRQDGKIADRKRTARCDEAEMPDFRITTTKDIRALTCREDRQFQIFRADTEPLDMVFMFMGDKNGAEADRVRQPALPEAANEFTEAEARVDKDALPSAMDNGGVAGTAASKYRHADMRCICFEHVCLK